MAPKQNKQNAQQLPLVEAKFTEAANKFYEKVLDLNTAQSTTANVISDVLNMRYKLLGMYGVPADSWKPGCFVQAGAGGVASAQAVSTDEISWVQKLYESMGKTLKKTLAKGEVAFATVATDETKKAFTSTCSSVHFPGQYSTSEPAVSKKAAEHAAAKLALEAEYPALFAKITAAPAAPAAAPAAGQKRKGADAFDDSNLKGKLNYFITLLLQRSISKEDVVYDTKELSPGSCSSTVKMPTYKASMSCTGTGATKKDAETAAAKAAIAALDGAVKPLMEEHLAKKAKKNKEGLEKLKQQREEKKAAKVAAAA